MWAGGLLLCNDLHTSSYAPAPAGSLPLIPAAHRENGQAAVSEAGFRFLLQDSHSQLWVLLRQYIRSKEGGPSLEPWAALMNFLMALGFRRVGQPYAWAELERAEAEAAAHLSQLGLLYPFMVGGCGGVWVASRHCCAADVFEVFWVA
jgi:hypothetical protein